MHANMLANRRAIAPRGIAGGGDAAPGVNRVIRADGSEETYPACVSVEMAAGDRFIVETPGGGGYGKATP
jgi:5-oxoprolinase (ATP-hydrolysing)